MGIRHEPWLPEVLHAFRTPEFPFLLFFFACCAASLVGQGVHMKPVPILDTPRPQHTHMSTDPALSILLQIHTNTQIVVRRGRISFVQETAVTRKKLPGLFYGGKHYKTENMFR